jgi:hypothetical protein
MPSRPTNPEHSPCRRPRRRAGRPSRSRKPPTFVPNREQANDSAGSRGVFWAERGLPLGAREPVRGRLRAVRGRRYAASKLGHRENPEGEVVLRWPPVPRIPGPPHPDPGQHGTHESGDPVIVQLHASTPLYVQLHVDPVHSASQTSPALSSHVDEHVIGPLPAALPPLEHEFTVPAGRGMFGHT